MSELTVTQSPTRPQKLPTIVQKFQLNYRAGTQLNSYYSAADQHFRSPSPVLAQLAFVDSIQYRRNHCHNRIGPVQQPLPQLKVKGRLCSNSPSLYTNKPDFVVE
jgi:hypothetical protein